jgi:hypothetical protein
MVNTKLDITDSLLRARQEDPAQFEKGSLRTINMSPGIKAIVGVKLGEKSTSVQSVLFDKKRYDETSAKSWLISHGSKFSDALELENQKYSLFSNSFDEHLKGHLPSLSLRQINRLMELAGPADDVDSEDDEESEDEDMTSRFARIV